MIISSSIKFTKLLKLIHFCSHTFFFWVLLKYEKRGKIKKKILNGHTDDKMATEKCTKLKFNIIIFIEKPAKSFFFFSLTDDQNLIWVRILLRGLQGIRNC